ncbi:hypothetical protein AB1Y20_016431 [Prymnesium parvum]|uniref:Protein xylosyltransferase n=1 Tax=Prymnesium parvum TaxID=97485 RepID=A0AB34IDA6_PRYPA
MAPFTFAVVIKGPLSHFTSLVLQYYLTQLWDPSTTAVAFSHNTASCSNNATALLALKAAHPRRFDFVLSPRPPRLGKGFRNAQREAAHHGVALALRRWRPAYVLLHRPDAAFRRAARSPPSRGCSDRCRRDATGGRGWASAPSRRGATDLGDMHGRFHLDDHCMFGEAAEVARYWSIHNPLYRRALPNSTALPPEVYEWYATHPSRLLCDTPGPESENGYLWVLWDGDEAELPSTQALFDEAAGRAFLFSPHAVGDYASVQLGPAGHRTRAGLMTLAHFPLRAGRCPDGTSAAGVPLWRGCDSSWNSQVPRHFGIGRAPYLAAFLCDARADKSGAMECRVNVTRAQVLNETRKGSPWPCPDPDEAAGFVDRHSAACAPSPVPPRAPGARWR